MRSCDGKLYNLQRFYQSLRILCSQGKTLNKQGERILMREKKKLFIHRFKEQGLLELG